MEHNLIEDIENKDDSSKPEEEVHYKSWEEIKEEEERENAILKKELDELVLFIWPEAKYKEPSNLPYCNTFALVMWECEYKKLYQFVIFATKRNVFPLSRDFFFVILRSIT